MLLTLKPPIQNGVKGPHEYSIIRQSIPAARSSSKPVAAGSAAKTPSPEPTMDNSRRGLPPPSAMTLPPESALPAVTAMGPLPPPPMQWHNAEDSMRQWLQTKAEEDRRRQEEERTRQESLRLEQRRIEQSMLRDAFHAGVPPHMVPLIFTGMAGGNAARSSLETNQQMESSPQSQPPQQHLRSLPPPPLSQQQQQSHLAPPPAPVQPPTPSYTLSDEVRRDSRAIPPNPYGSQAGSALPAPPPSHAVPPSPTQPPAFGHVAGPALLHPPTDHRPPLPPSSLSRLNTGDMHIHQPPANVGSQYQPSPASTQPPPTAPVKPESQAQQSPSIYFHHWVPPGQSQPNTPSGKSSETTPHSHLRSEYQISPGRKRKAQGSHQPAPPPSSQPAQSSPALSHASPRHGTPRRGHRQGHLRHQSDISHESRYHEYQDQDPESGHRQSRPSGHESLMNPVHSDPENTSRRTSRGPGASADPQSARPERHEATAPPSHYGEPQGPSQPSGYGTYHRPS